MKKTRCFFLFLTLALLLTACGSGEDEQLEGSVLWFCTSGEANHGPALTTQIYEGETRPEALLAALLNGPTQEGLYTPFPRGVILRQCGWDETRPGVLLVNLSEQYEALADISLTLADYCIVLTLTQVEGVETVEITTEGRHVSYRSHQLLASEEAMLWDELADGSRDIS